GPLLLQGQLAGQPEVPADDVVVGLRRVVLWGVPEDDLVVVLHPLQAVVMDLLEGTDGGDLAAFEGLEPEPNRLAGGRASGGQGRGSGEHGSARLGAVGVAQRSGTSPELGGKKK